MKKLLFLSALFCATISFAQVTNAKMTDITKKFVMIDSKVDGDVINIRYDSIKVYKETMKEAVRSYLTATLLKTSELNKKHDDLESTIVGNPTEKDLAKMEKYVFAVSTFSQKQKVLVLEKMEKADNTKKAVIHTKAKYYLKLDDNVTDGNYQSDYYFTLDGLPIDDIYTYFLEKIN